MFNRGKEGDSGFDIVIGNPPYVSAPGQLLVESLTKQRELLAQSPFYETLYQKWDLFIPFMERALKLLASNGTFSMIVPYPITNQLYGKKFREWILSNYNVSEVTDLRGTKIFENATVSNVIIFAQKLKPQSVVKISQIDEVGCITIAYSKDKETLKQDEKTQVWNLTQEKRQVNRYQLLRVLGDYCYVSYGLRPNSDEKTAKGEFKKEDLISDFKDSVSRREYIEAKDIEKYSINRIRYLEYGTERSPDKLVRPTFKEWFDNPKIMFNRLGDLKGVYDNEHCFLHNDSLIGASLWKDLYGVENKSINASIKKFSSLTRLEMEKLSKTVSLKFLLGIMNSKYATTLLTNQRGGDYHIYPEHIRNIPIPTATPTQQQEIITLVDKILTTKKTDPTADTTDIEKQIDQLVYKLYRLTEEEINVIEEK